MAKAKITIKSPLVSKNPPREDRKPTVYKRVIRKLTEDGRHPGKILQVYVNVDGDYKILGLFSFNTGGSISFFPDFHNLDNFDHLTLNKDFLTKNGHLTIVTENGKHKKLLDFQANKLDTGDYHLITFAMQDGDLLMDVFPEMEFPEIEYPSENEESILALLKDALHRSAHIISFPEEQGFYCVQILVIPKGRNINDISIFNSILEKALVSPEPLDKIINAKKLEIATPDDYDFSLCAIAFRVNKALSAPMSFWLAKVANNRIVS